jgi:hypothetical protein
MNNILGWFMGVFASAIYIITSEPTVSFWDCGEYISTAYKLLVGHPPGAPLFQLTGRFFSLFAMGDTALVARMVNTMTAVSSGFTIMFLFWSITMLARKAVGFKENNDKGNLWVILGAGLVGAMAYTFTDSFWFSAVEGEVYGMSSFFTAVVFWAILKYDDVRDPKAELRWIIFIFYMVGLSIGVHLLNLLTIPAMTFVFYFKKYNNPNWKGMLITGVLSFVILGVIMSLIIPWVLKLAGWFELFFVNTIGFPFNFGTVIYFILLTGGILWGLMYTSKQNKLIGNTIILAFTFLLIGYSSFFTLVIRSNADTPIDENNPDNAINLLAYMQREQYGDWPIMYGHYYNAPTIGREDGNPVYTKDKKTGKYVITDQRKGVLPKYDPRFMTIFPRMWSDSQDEHAKAYQYWANIKGKPIGVEGSDGQTETINKPTFGENLRFFSRYQVNFMYLRYFMWNFVGRQNDVQGMGHTQNPKGDIVNGNWLSGIKFLDEMRLGPQDNLPESMKNRGNNKFYFLPLILGMIGLYYHSRKHYKDSLVVIALFFMTGLAIVLYLNQYAPQPRERDYAYAASFYAFAIWIGLGVIPIYDLLKKYLAKVNPVMIAAGVTLVCTLSVPGLLAKEGWDDHDRSGRYSVLQIASCYLNTCAPNAILFTNGDNDTFPLWYAQEVEGIRTDVRVCNLSLLQTDWYIDQMKRKAYLSEAVPFSLTKEKYRQGTLDVVYLYDNPEVVDTNRFYDLKDLIKFVASDNPNTKLQTEMGKLDYIPTTRLRIPVDKETVLKNGTVSPEQADQIVPAIEWRLDRQGVSKNHLMVLDLLSNFNWSRPIYFAMTIGDENYLGLEEYFQLEGLAYRLVPIKSPVSQGGPNRLNTTVMYDHLMNKFKLDMSNPAIYYNDDHLRMCINMRNVHGKLASTLLAEGKRDSALAVCDRCLKIMPDNVAPFNFSILPIADTYYKAGAKDKAVKIMDRLITLYGQELDYFFTFKGFQGSQVSMEKEIALGAMQRIGTIAERNNDTVTNAKSKTYFEKYYQQYIEQEQMTR